MMVETAIDGINPSVERPVSLYLTVGLDSFCQRIVVRVYRGMSCMCNPIQRRENNELERF